MSGSDNNSQLINRHDRVNLFKDLPHFKVRCLGKELEIVNISTSGVAVRDLPVSDGQLCTFQFVINREDFEVVLKVVRKTADLIGLQYQEASSSFIATLSQFFQVERRAKALNFVDPRFLNAEMNKGDVFWFRSGKGDELVYTHSKEKIHSLQAMVMNYGWEYSEDHGMSFGEFSKGADKAYSPWVPGRVAGVNLKEIFSRFVENIDPLAKEHKEQLILMLKK